MENPFIAFEEEIAELKAQLAAKSPQWTRTRPTRAGWYWARVNGVVCTVEVYAPYRNKLQVTMPQGPTLDIYELDHFDLWCPIEAPPLPDGT